MRIEALQETVLELAANRQDARPLEFGCFAGDTGAAAHSYAIGLAEAGLGEEARLTVLDEGGFAEGFERREFSPKQVLFGGHNGVDETYLESHFERTEEDTFRLKPVGAAVAFEAVEWGQKPLSKKRFDFLICENHLFHCEKVTFSKTFAAMVELIKPGGYLVVGPAPLPLLHKHVLLHKLDPVTSRLEEIHDGWKMRRAAYEAREPWGLEPIDRTIDGWDVRYATLFRKPASRS